MAVENIDVNYVRKTLLQHMRTVLIRKPTNLDTAEEASMLVDKSSSPKSSKVRKFGRKSKKGFLAFVASAVMQKKKLKVCRKWSQTRFRQKAALLKQQWLPGTMTEPQKRNRRNRNDLVPKFFRSSEKFVSHV